MTPLIVWSSNVSSVCGKHANVTSVAIIGFMRDSKATLNANPTVSPVTIDNDTDINATITDRLSGVVRLSPNYNVTLQVLLGLAWLRAP